MALEFTWDVHAGSSGQAKLRAVEVQFGDGYSQATQDGINARAETWNIRIAGTVDEMAPVRTFLDAHEGWVSFLWTPPGGDEGYYRCTGYDVDTRGASNIAITAEFKQVFQP